MLLKSIFDTILSILLFIFSLPFLILFSIIIFIEIRSFPIYFQERGLTLEKNRFIIYKLKTIKPREKNIPHITEQDIFLKPGLREKVSPFCKWLRKTGLDELPQLLNVIAGKMNLIGPRPLMIEDLETMKKVSPEFYERRNSLTSKPGISGLWQLFGNRNEGILGMMALESLYEKVVSPFLDLKLIAYTATVSLLAKNSDSIFFIEKPNGNRVETIIDSTSNLKVRLNMPEGIAKFIVEKVEKLHGKYTIEIPKDWWYVTNSYNQNEETSEKPQIFQLKKSSKKNVS